ncbi:DCL family protein [Asticcacaulis sp. BE141]|uniref:DCL family protein n=1 Tax=Asticcacaulis TaxID=76890 RepID=UPI0038571A3F
MLSRYSIGDVLNENDTTVLSALLKRHPDYDRKVGSGVARFDVILADYGTHCFRIIRTDGTKERFSYPTCISGKSRD